MQKRLIKEGKDFVEAIYFDLGGGTADLAFMELRNTQFITKAVVGSNHLGGGDIDKRLVQEVLLDELVKKHGIVLTDANALLRLQEAAQLAKERLSFNEKVIF
jgi:heat shock 70kDa protein 1/2/6/8